MDKKLTLKYWNALPLDTKKRAINAAMPNMGNFADWFSKEKVDMTNQFWKIIFSKVRIPTDGYYKVVVNGWSMM